MKKPVLSIDEPVQVKPPRADIPPPDGFILVVDGHFKTRYDTAEAADEAARKLKARFGMLKIQTFDAGAKVWSAVF